MSSRRAASSIKTIIDRRVQEASTVTQLGRVSAVSPFKIELLEMRATLYDDEISLTQWVRRYHATDTIDVGDTVIVVRKKTGGEIHWLICDVLADKDPTV